LPGGQILSGGFDCLPFLTRSHLELWNILWLALHIAQAEGFDDFVKFGDHLLVSHNWWQIDHQAVECREFKVVSGIHDSGFRVLKINSSKMADVY